MKLATALHERALLQQKLPELQRRLQSNAKVQEGDTPSEAPEELLQELNDTLCRLQDLLTRINLTNARTLCDGKTLTELLAERECLLKRVTIQRSFLETASQKVDLYSRKEIVVRSTVDVARLRKRLDADSEALRGLDEKLQEMNWLTELLEK